MLGEARRIGGKLSLVVLTLALTIWLASGATVFAHGGGGGGGGHGGGGGFGGGHMGGFGGGFGGGYGGFGRGIGYGGFGGLGRFGYGGFGYGGFGWGYPWYGYGLGYGYGGYGLGGYGLGYGYGGYGLGGYGLGGYGLGGYGLGGYGMGGYGMGGYGMGGYGMGGYGMGGYGYPSYGYGVASANPAAGAGFSYSPAYVAPGQAASPNVVNGRRILGIDEEPVALADGRKAMKITNVYSGTGAQTAGLQVGDVLISVNGYLTEQRGNLAWIIANATPGKELKLVVRTVKDGKDHTIIAAI